MTSMHDKTVKAANELLPAVIEISFLNGNISDYRLVEFAHIAASSDNEMSEQEEKLSKIKNKIYKNFEIITNIVKDKETLVLYQEFQKNWDEYENTTSEVLALSRKKLPKEAEAKMKTASLTKFNLSKQTLNKLNELTNNLAYYSDIFQTF